MDENDVKIGTECMNDIQEMLKKHGCGIELIVSFSSIHGPSFIFKTIPLKNIVLSNQMPPKMGMN